MRWPLAVGVFSLSLLACTPNQEAAHWVEAVEIPVDVATEREELVALLSGEARRHSGLHVDDTSLRSARYHADSAILEPDQRPTLSITVWRGEDDDQLVATVSDLFHRGRVWATFNRGKNPKQETPFREAAIALIRERWRETKSLPIIAGGLPNPEDFVLTDGSYKIRQSAAQDYDLPPESNLMAPD
jgi:hypothetical protein